MKLIHLHIILHEFHALTLRHFLKAILIHFGIDMVVVYHKHIVYPVRIASYLRCVYHEIFRHLSTRFQPTFHQVESYLFNFIDRRRLIKIKHTFY